jgi:hypothetical protein
MNRKDPKALNRVHDALPDHCNIPASGAYSILFGAEKVVHVN